MVVWSSFFVNNILKKTANRHILHIFSKPGCGSTTEVFRYVPVRHSGHNTLYIRESKFFFAKFKDLMLFYLLVGIIPLGAVVFYANVFIGPAKLSLIPEGYTPKHWEYYESPVTRFLAKYFATSPQELHERNMHCIFVKNEKYMLKRELKKIKDLIRERQDYQAWYFLAPDKKYRESSKERQESYHFEQRGQGMGTLR